MPAGIPIEGEGERFAFALHVVGGGPHRVIADWCGWISPPRKFDVYLMCSIGADVGCRIIEKPQHYVPVQLVHRPCKPELITPEAQAFLSVDLGAVPFAVPMRQPQMKVAIRIDQHIVWPPVIRARTASARLPNNPRVAGERNGRGLGQSSPDKQRGDYTQHHRCFHTCALPRPTGSIFDTGSIAISRSVARLTFAA